MNDRSEHRMHRRRMLQLGLAAVAGSQLASVPMLASAADLPKVDPESGTAKALAYVHDASNADPALRKDETRLCSNCRFYTQPDAEWGLCSLFPGKAVAAKGWCNGWVAKA